jgi:DnaK suppressor protein
LHGPGEKSVMSNNLHEHCAGLRALLERRLVELGAEIRAVSQAQLQQPAVAGSEVTDLKDLAGERAAANLSDMAQRRDLEEEELVTAALLRMDQGTYGRCLDCEEPISLERLKMLPSAPRCAACQAAHERVHGRMGRGRAA